VVADMAAVVATEHLNLRVHDRQLEPALVGAVAVREADALLRSAIIYQLSAVSQNLDLIMVRIIPLARANVPGQCG